MAFPIYDTTMQDDIAYRLHNKVYADLQPADKAAIDGNSVTLTTGHAFDAMTLLQRYNNFLAASGAATAPAEWRGWFLAETVYRCAMHMHPDRVREYAGLRKDALIQAIETYTQLGTDDTDTATNFGWLTTNIAIRKYVLDICVHQERMLLPTPERIDQAMRSRFVRVWNMGNWPFRRVQLTVTLPTSGQPTYSGSHTPDAITSTKMYYTDTAGKGSALVAVPADDMAYLLSQGYSTGRPRYCQITQLGAATAGTPFWVFERTPDQSYTVRAEVATVTPALTTPALFNTAMALLPPELLELLRESVGADVLESYGRPEGREMVKRVDAQWAEYLAPFIDNGHMDEREAVSESRATVADLIAGQHDGWGGIMGGQT